MLTPGILQLMSEAFDESKLDTLEGSVFDDMIDLFERMRTEMLNNVVHYVADDVKARSRPYRKDKYVCVAGCLLILA